MGILRGQCAATPSTTRKLTREAWATPSWYQIRPTILDRKLLCLHAAVPITEHWWLNRNQPEQ